MSNQGPWTIQVFYDGACPLCSHEVKQYRQLDRLGRIHWLDIAAPGFDATAYGLDSQRIQQVMHAIAPDGQIYTELSAFVKIWEALPPTLLTRFLRGIFKVPGMLALGGIFYRAFARNRYRLTGRCTPESCSTPP